MDTFGDRLKSEREDRELSIEALAETLRVDQDLLRALERNDFDSLPGEAEMMDCLHAYAKCLEVDADLMIEDYLQERENHLREVEDSPVVQVAEAAPAPIPPAAIPATGQAGKRGRPISSLWLLPLAVLAIVMLTALWMLSRTETAPSAPTANTADAAEAPEASVASAPTASAGTAVASPPEPTTLPPVTTATAHPGQPLPEQPVGAAPTDPGQPTPEPSPATVTAAPLQPPKEEAATEVIGSEPPTPIATGSLETRPEPLAGEVIAQPSSSETPAAVDPLPMDQPAARTTSRPPPLRVTEYGVGTAVEDRQLVAQSDRFPVGTRVAFWTRVRGGPRGDKVDHIWLREGVETMRRSLNIGAASWRTHSIKTLHPGSAGNWAVEARDEAGRVLARGEFVCVP